MMSKCYRIKARPCPLIYSCASQRKATKISKWYGVNNNGGRYDSFFSATQCANTSKRELLESRHKEFIGAQDRRFVDFRLCISTDRIENQFLGSRSLSTKSSVDKKGVSEDEDPTLMEKTAANESPEAEGKREGAKGEGGEKRTDSSDGQESASENTSKNVGEKQDVEDTDKNSSTTASSSASFDVNTLIYQIRSGWDTFQEELAKTWDELLKSNQPKGVNKRIHDPITKQGSSSSSDGGNIDNEAADKYDGVTAIAVIKEDMSAWEKMQRRLTEAPIIQSILGASSEAFKKVGGDKAKQRLEDLKADASEAWETSQNPWVYRLSSVYDTLTAESEFALAVKELRRLDPEFTSLEQFKNDVMETLIPELMSFIMEGQTKQLKPLMGEAVYNRLAAEIRVRKAEGLVVDPHILGMENSEILAAELDENQRGSPIILLHYMCQQINCVRNKDTGEIVEGGEDEIRANSYIVALQREYDDQEGALNWKVVDFRFNGGIPWI